MVVRESQRTKQVMIILVCKTEGFPQEQLNSIKEKVVDYLKQCVIGLKSLCFLSYNGESDSVPT